MLINVLRWQPSWISHQHKKPKLFRGPSNDYSWAVWFQLSKWFKRRSVLKHFSHRVQCYTKSCCSHHFEFHIRTKNLNIKYYIYTNRCLKKKLSFHSLKACLINLYKTEKMIAVRNQRIAEFQLHWSTFEKLFEDC